MRIMKVSAWFKGGGCCITEQRLETSFQGELCLTTFCKFLKLTIQQSWPLYRWLARCAEVCKFKYNFSHNYLIWVLIYTMHAFEGDSLKMCHVLHLHNSSHQDWKGTQKTKRFLERTGGNCSSKTVLSRGKSTIPAAPWMHATTYNYSGGR